MIKIYLLDDDDSVRQILRIIIKDKNLGEVCGSSDSALDALNKIVDINPDIVIVDLLMPDMDGITFVRKAKKLMNRTSFIMLSQVSSKDMIAKAYDAGVEFFIQKPINGIEVINVIERIAKLQSLQRTMESVQSLFARENAANAVAPKEEKSEYEVKLKQIIQKLGISAERGSDDIINVVCYFCEHQDELNQAKLSDICSRFSDSPKSMEQRMRRTAATGLSNIASIGLDDYGNEIFEQYAGTLFKFEQVRKEMDFIKSKSTDHGNVQIKKFIIGLVQACIE